MTWFLCMVATGYRRMSPAVQTHALKRIAWRAQGCPSSVWQRNCARIRLVDFLHLGGLVCRTLNLLKRREIIIVTKALVIVINAEAELDHAVNPACELRRLVK